MCSPRNGYMSCPKNYAIRVHNITIGCTDQYICEDWTGTIEDITGEQQRVSETPGYGYTALQISEVCNNRRECIITGLHYEKCRGKYKYIAVNYDCYRKSLHLILIVQQGPVEEQYSERVYTV